MPEKLDDLHLKDRSINYLVAFRAVMAGLGYQTIAHEIEEELQARGYPLPCSCYELAGDNPQCPEHGRRHD